MWRSIISLLKEKWHIKFGTITHSAKETRQQKKQCGGGWRQQGRGLRQNLKKRVVVNLGGSS